MTIVVVDNDAKEMDSLALQIQKAFHGSECLRFIDPMLSLKYIANNSTDMVFTAEKMRPANGIELLRNIRRICPELPVVIIAEDDVMRERAKKLAADGYLRKPVTAQQLLAFDKIMEL